MATNQNLTQTNGHPEILARTPLYELCVKLGGRMVPFAGWEMPVQFTGITAEHLAVRSNCGIFDISHMGKFLLKGTQLIDHFQSLVPSDLAKLEPGQAQYTVLLNDRGGILDDIIFYYQGAGSNNLEEAVIIVNASTRIRDKAWILSHLESTPIRFEDVSAHKILMAVQGPNAVKYLQDFVIEDLSSIKSFGHLQTTIFGQAAFIARTGYTGENGFEIMLDPSIGIQLWQELVNVGALPCGLGARDTLRLEATMALYGQDIDSNITPFEAGLGWLVHLDSKGEFIGRDALESQKNQGVSKRLVCLEMQGKYIARHGYNVIFDGKVVGEVTSGTMSPTLQKAIALAYVPTNLAKIGQLLEVEIRGKNYPAIVVKRPFYKSNNR